MAVPNGNLDALHQKLQSPNPPAQEKIHALADARAEEAMIQAKGPTDANAHADTQLDPPSTTQTSSITPARPTPIRAPTNPLTKLPHLRAPATWDPNFEAPPLDWLAGTWWVTHSSMPFWKDKRNITITYNKERPDSTNLPSALRSQGTNRLDDVVEYQDAKSDKIREVKGKNVAAPDDAPEADGSGWDWRGKGLIKAAYSTWSIIGWGEDPDTGNAWMVTYFKKTVFTPAAVQMYCRDEEGLSERMVERLKKALEANEFAEVRKLGSQLYAIKNDGARSQPGSPRGSLEGGRPGRGSLDAGRPGRASLDGVNRRFENMKV